MTSEGSEFLTDGAEQPRTKGVRKIQSADLLRTAGRNHSDISKKIMHFPDREC